MTQVIAPVAADMTATPADTSLGPNSASQSPAQPPAQSPAQPTAPPGSNLKAVHLDITGMTCPGCSNSINTYLGKQPGVKTVDITFAQRGGTVVYDPQTISAQEIATSKVFQGYYNASITKVADHHEKS